MQSGPFLSDREFFYFTRPLSPDNSPSSDNYLRKKVFLSIVGISMALLYFAVLAFTGAVQPFMAVSGISKNIFVSFLVFVFAVEIVFSLIKFPVDYYADFVLERRYGLSDQTFGKWLFRKMKEAI
ncbi:MAG: hypothetical protein M1339_02390, partial [Bacteroidetes bacterium]|nr:hypothetical protein [Bacteroidota bacterium]